MPRPRAARRRSCAQSPFVGCRARRPWASHRRGRSYALRIAQSPTDGSSWFLAPTSCEANHQSRALLDSLSFYW